MDHGQRAQLGENDTTGRTIWKGGSPAQLQRLQCCAHAWTEQEVWLAPVWIVVGVRILVNVNVGVKQGRAHL